MPYITGIARWLPGDLKGSSHELVSERHCFAIYLAWLCRNAGGPDCWAGLGGAGLDYSLSGRPAGWAGLAGCLAGWLAAWLTAWLPG